MQGRAMQARVVQVKIERGEGGYFYARSDDLKGLLVVEPTLDAAEKAIPQAISDLYSVSGTRRPNDSGT